METCPFCKEKEVEMKPVPTTVALEALGLDMSSTLGGMLEKALSNPKGKVYKCPACGFIAIFA